MSQQKVQVRHRPDCCGYLLAVKEYLNQHERDASVVGRCPNNPSNPAR